MDVWSQDRDRADLLDEIKKVGKQEGAIQSYRWQSGKLREISVFPLTKLIMDVPRSHEAELKTQSQSRNTSEARAVAGWLARELGCATLSDIAKLVNRDVGSISSAVRRLSDHMQGARELAERMRSLKAALEAT